MVYPEKYETEVGLKDGVRLKFRPIRPEDAEAWLAFISRLSPESKYLRFFQIAKDWRLDDARRYCTVDYKDSFALVAEVSEDVGSRIIAVARYSRLPSAKTAEFAIVVEDAFQGEGIGTMIMEQLVKVAVEDGITAFQADVLTENTEMMAFLRDFGFRVTRKLDYMEYLVTFPLNTPERE